MTEPTTDTGGEDRDDELQERLLTRLRDLASTADPVPPDAELAARSAWAYRRLDAELADLLDDSLEEDQELAGVRSVTAVEPRLLRFGAGERGVEVEVTTRDSRRELVGQVVPAEPALIELRTPDQIVQVETDDLGRFRASLAPALVSLRCTWADGPRIETPWVRM